LLVDFGRLIIGLSIEECQIFCWCDHVPMVVNFADIAIFQKNLKQLAFYLHQNALKLNHT